MIQLLRWLRACRVPGLLHNMSERRHGRERRQCQDRRCEPRRGESSSSRRHRQRREVQHSGC